MTAHTIEKHPPLERIWHAGPLWSGRAVAVAYLLYLVATGLTEFFMEQAGAGVRTLFTDSTATATSILAHETSYRLGFALDLIAIACYVLQSGCSTSCSGR